MKHELELFHGTKLIAFGENRESIRSKIVSYEEFTRNEFSQNSSDYVESDSYFIEYNSHDLCEAMEFSNDCQVVLDDLELFSLSFKEFTEYFKEASTNSELEDGSSYFYDLGIAGSEGEDDTLESIIIFSKDYWS